LALQAGDKESASNWRELFSDLKRCGLDPRRVILGIMDGLSELEKVFKGGVSKGECAALPDPCSSECVGQGAKEIEGNCG